MKNKLGKNTKKFSVPKWGNLPYMIEKKNLSITSFVISFFFLVLVCILPILVLKKIYDPKISKVVGPSMFPSIMNGDRILVQLKFEKIERGDIVCFTGNDRLSSYIYLIKRVIGIPGDFVLISNGRVFVNTIPESNSNIINYETKLPENETSKFWKLEENEYFMMGDNRPMSYDCRNFGPVIKEKIEAKLLFRIRPLVILRN